MIRLLQCFGNSTSDILVSKFGKYWFKQSLKDFFAAEHFRTFNGVYELRIELRDGST